MFPPLSQRVLSHKDHRHTDLFSTWVSCHCCFCPRLVTLLSACRAPSSPRGIRELCGEPRRVTMSGLIAQVKSFKHSTCQEPCLYPQYGPFSPVYQTPSPTPAQPHTLSASETFSSYPVTCYCFSHLRRQLISPRCPAPSTQPTGSLHS